MNKQSIQAKEMATLDKDKAYSIVHYAKIEFYYANSMCNTLKDTDPEIETWNALRTYWQDLWFRSQWKLEKLLCTYE